MAVFSDNSPRAVGYDESPSDDDAGNDDAHGDARNAPDASGDGRRGCHGIETRPPSQRQARRQSTIHVRPKFNKIKKLENFRSRQRSASPHEGAKRPKIEDDGDGDLEIDVQNDDAGHSNGTSSAPPSSSKVR